MPETYRVFFDKIKFGKFVRLFGFIKKNVTMHGHMNVKPIKLLAGHLLPPAKDSNLLIER
jgi:hypothetical protein